ncbi:MAG: GTPase HflX [Planctomycetota bacterium]
MAKQSFDLPLLHGEPAAVTRGVVVKAILPDDPSLQTPGIDPLEEITSLADTAGLEIVGAVMQRRRRPHATTYLGKGKLEEVCDVVRARNADVVLFDDPLSPGQGKNIEERTNCRVIDRVELIMDIFATHARSHQAKLQVELAQLKYSSSRLKRMWTHLSRFEGGIGTRGPGETQLETDRRIIRKKIDILKSKLAAIEKQCLTQHKARADAFRVALVGYTNAGKSTLMRRLTGADVLVEDRLFSTLDTSTRQWEIPGHREVILSDTVGFIRKLPPSLVASFHATLMEAREADLLLHVVDGSSSHVEADMEAVQMTLEQIGCGDKKSIVLFNKIDRLPEERRIDLQYYLAQHPESIVVSAVEGTNIDGEGGVTDRVLECICDEEVTCEYELPIARADLVAQLRRYGTILDERYDEASIVVSARLQPDQQHRFETLLAKNGLFELPAPSAD